MSRAIIENGVIVTKDQIFPGTVVIEDQIIEQIFDHDVDKNWKSQDVIINAAGKYIIPGGVDPHVHMELDTGEHISSDDFYSGSKAALAGGTTTIIDFVTPDKHEDLITAYEKRIIQAQKSCCSYAFHMSIVFYRESLYQELKLCKEKGIHSVKIYMAYSMRLRNDEIRKVMQICKELDITVMVHCEMGEAIDSLQHTLGEIGQTAPSAHPLSRPDECEWMAVETVAALAKDTGCSLYIVHISSGKSMDIIEQYRKKGAHIYAETCPHYLLLDDSYYLLPDFESAKYVLSPPLRSKENNEQLWNYISNSLIDTVGTDHCPFNFSNQKIAGKDDFTKIPNGAGSVEERLKLLYHYGVQKNIISMSQFVSMIAAKPASIFKLDKKGDIAVGNDADLILWNQNASQIISAQTHHMHVDYSLYEGFSVMGIPELVFHQGTIVYENGKFPDNCSR